MNYKINFLVTTCLINIFTIEVFSQDCCKECCDTCLEWFHSDEKSEEENNKQNNYFNSLLSDFDNNVKTFTEEVFSENTDSTDVEYTIVKDGTPKSDGILGKESYGTVYKVKNKEGKYFALKKSFISEDKESATKKEIQILVKCRDCKNVIKIVDVYKKLIEQEIEKKNVVGKKKNYYYYIITETYEGDNLKNFIKKCRKKDTGLSDEEINLKKEKYIYQMINAVNQIHDKGIKHININPANFFIGKDDSLYLGNFNFATENNSRVRTINKFFFPALYNKCSGDNFKKVDIYSLSCVIYSTLQNKNFCNVKINKLEKFIPSDRWEKCKKDKIPDGIKEELGKVFTSILTENLDINLFLESKYYKELDKKYSKEYGKK